MRDRAKGAWLVTGAASGIGQELARSLAARGEALVLWDQNAEALEAIARALDAQAQVVDVTSEAAVRAAAESNASVAHVVHCAGILRVGSFETVTATDHARMMQVNFLGTVHVAQAFAPMLRRTSDRSQLVFFASIAGLRGFPGLAGYSASKFAVVGYAQALRAELRGSGVDIRVVCPPAARTPMVESLPELPAIYKLSPLMDATQAAHATLAALDGGGWLHVLDTRSRALRFFDAWAPGVVDGLIRRVARE